MTLTIEIGDIWLEGFWIDVGVSRYWDDHWEGRDWVKVACEALPDHAETIRAIAALNEARYVLHDDMTPVHHVAAMAGPDVDVSAIEERLCEVYRHVATAAGADGLIEADEDRTWRVLNDAQENLVYALIGLVDAVVCSRA